MTSNAGELTIVVCMGPSCSLMGGRDLVQWCKDLEAAGLAVSHQIRGCTGNCMESPVVQWNGRYLTACSPTQLTEKLINEEIM